MAKRQKISGKQLFSYGTFALNNFGHTAFYGVMSTYFIIFVTSSLFSGLDSNVADKLIGLITGLMVAIRVGELFIDPILGNIVDNTKTKWGKFKPWILGGKVMSVILLLILFTGIFGLASKSPLWFTILFIIIFLCFDIFYSLSDVSYWGMVPALTESSSKRGVYTSLATFGGILGMNSLTIIVMPIVTGVTFMLTGHHQEGTPGWFTFAAVVSAVAIITALLVCLGTKEKQNIIRSSAKQSTSVKDVFSAIFHNDQILWPSLAYLMFCLAYTVTNAVLFYLYKFVIGKPNQFWIVGVIAAIIGIFVNPLFPVLNKYIPRKWLFIGGQVLMVLSYLIFIFARNNVVMMDLGLVLFDINFSQLVTILTITDAIEYGQLRTGERNEAVVLAVRPMIDKFSGAVSNALVGVVAVAAGMTGSATAASMTPHDINVFDLLALVVPMILAILAIVIFASKVTLSEKKHAQIVEELKDKLAKGEVEKAPASPQKPRTTTIYAPATGTLMPMSEVTDENGQPFPGKGFGIDPSTDQIYAPFDGKVEFTFGTKHAFEITSDNGLKVVVHIGLGTVNLRGQGFTTYYEDGQTVKKGQRLLSFDKDLIKTSGYKSTIVTFFTEPGNISKMPKIIADRKIKHGDLVSSVEFK